MSKTNSTRYLQGENYSFDHARNRWFCGKKPVDEDEVLIKLIKYGKSQGIKEAGDWGANALESAKTTPEMTTAGFRKAHMVRNRNRRVAGKYLFAMWCKSVGIKIAGKLEDFMARHSLIVARFYHEIADGFECCKTQARVCGRAVRSVFIGWELRDEDNTSDVIEDGAVSSHTEPHTGLLRHIEFMTKLFAADP